MPDPVLAASGTAWQQPDSQNVKPQQHSMHNRLNPDTDVMLRVECMSSNSLKALIFQGDVIRFLTVALLIVFIVLESVHKLVRQHSRADFIASAVIGGICSALLFAQGIYLVHILRQVRKLHKQWTKRKQRLVIAVGISIALMMPAFLLWTSQNAWAASGGQCRFYSNYCRSAEAIVWTLFNCWLLLQLVLTHAATAWLDADGKPLQHFVIKRRCWLEAAPRPALMVDAP